MSYSEVEKELSLMLCADIAAIPDSFRLAAHRIVQGYGDDYDVRVIDQFLVARKSILKWVETILTENEIEITDRIMAWWKDRYE